MHPRLKSILKYLLLLVIAFGLFAIAFRGVNIEILINQILHAKIIWVLFSAFISIAAFISRAYRWLLLIEPMGYSPSLKKTTYSLMVGYFANLAFPRIGEVSRCGALSKAESIPFNKLLGTVIVERVIDVISLLVCIVLATVIEFKRLGDFFNENVFTPLLKKGESLIRSPLAVIAAVVLILLLISLLFFYFRKNKLKEKESRFAKLIHGLTEGLKSVGQLKRSGLFIFHSIFIWALYYLGVYVCLSALPSTSNLGPGAALFLLVAGGLGMSAPVQGGIGAYHLLVSQGLVLYGLSKQDGLAFATLLHSLQLILVVLFGVIAFFLLFADRKNAAKHSAS